MEAVFNLCAENPAGKFGYSLVLRIEVVSIGSDAQLHFDINYFEAHPDHIVFCQCLLCLFQKGFVVLLR